MVGLRFAPLVDNMSADEAGVVMGGIYGPRPRFRGRFHQLGAVASVPAGLYLVARFAGPGTRTAAAAFALTWSLMFMTSASYHRLAHSIMARFWMRRLDHAMILIHIAGATTPIALLGVRGKAGLSLLILSWGGAIIGVGLKLTQLTAERDPCPWLFPIMGWLPLMAIPWLAVTSGVKGVALLLMATAMYALGGICFAKKNPDPAPTVFGYHEIFHICTLAAGACQFLLTVQLVST